LGNILKVEIKEETMDWGNTFTYVPTIDDQIYDALSNFTLCFWVYGFIIIFLMMFFYKVKYHVTPFKAGVDVGFNVRSTKDADKIEWDYHKGRSGHVTYVGYIEGFVTDITCDKYGDSILHIRREDGRITPIHGSDILSPTYFEIGKPYFPILFVKIVIGWAGISLFLLFLNILWELICV
jgi:hypothetical protein